MSQYPKYKFKKSLKKACGYHEMLVANESEEKTLGSGWFESPAHFGVETHPSTPVVSLYDDGEDESSFNEPIPVVYESGQEDAPKRRGRPPKAQE